MISRVINIVFLCLLSVTIYGQGVGVNTTSPDRMLDVEDNSGSPQFRITHTDVTDYADMSVDANGYLGIVASGARVGIGTVTPASMLDIDANSNTAALTIRGTAGAAEVGEIYMGAAGQMILSTIAGTDSDAAIDLRSEDDQYGLLLRESDGTGATTFANFYVTDAASDYLTIDVNAATTGSLVVTEGTLVGIGTTVPATKLDIDANSNTSAIRIRGLDGPNEVGDIYMGSSGEMVLSTKSGDGTGAALIDLQSEDNNFGVVIRASDGSVTTTYANFYVTDAATDYMTINLNSVKDADALVITEGDDIGIGTSGPDQKLDIEDNSGNPQLRLSHTDAVDYTDFAVDANGYLGILPSGNRVGIGTTLPIDNLAVYEAGAAVVLQYFQNGSTGTTSTDGFSLGIDASMAAYINQREAQPLQVFVNGAERMRIGTTGLVGIGNTNPQEQLHLGGAIIVGAAANTNDGTIRYTAGNGFEGRHLGAWIPFDTDFTNGGEVGGAARTLGNTDANSLGFITTNVERISIAAGGSVTINETGAVNKDFRVETADEYNFFIDGGGATAGNVGINTSAPAEKLHIYDTGGSTDVYMEIESDADVAGLIIDSDAGSDSEILFEEDGVESAIIRYDGGNDFLSFYIDHAGGAAPDETMRLENGSNAVHGDGAFTATSFGSSEWVIGNASNGDVICMVNSEIDVDKKTRAVTQICNHVNCSKVLGVVLPEDETPGFGTPSFAYRDKFKSKTGRYWLEDWKESHVGVELSGFRMTKVIGKVEVGDLLVSSGIPGYAIATDKPGAGAILGKAAEGQEDGKGMIWARIHLQSGSNLFKEVDDLKSENHLLRAKLDRLEQQVNILLLESSK